MKKFTFRMQTILNMREHAEDAQKRRLAEKNKQIQTVEADIQQYQEQIQTQQFTHKNTAQQMLNITSFRSMVSFRHSMKKKLLQTMQQLQLLQAEREQIRRDLLQATREKKALEFLKQKRYDAWRAERRKSENSQTDEVAQNVFIRQNN